MVTKLKTDKELSKEKPLQGIFIPTNIFINEIKVYNLRQTLGSRF